MYNVGMESDMGTFSDTSKKALWGLLNKVSIVLGIGAWFLLILSVIGLLTSIWRDILFFMALGSVAIALIAFIMGGISLTAYLCIKSKPFSQDRAIGGVVISGIFLMLSACFLPAVKKPKDGVGYTRIMCMANMRSLAIACILYTDDNGTWPDKTNWCDSAKFYLGDEDIFQCYIDKIGPCSYAMNVHIPVDAEELPGDLVLLFESAPGWNRVGGIDDVVTDRHERPGANIAFADGRVEFVEAAKIAELRWVVDDSTEGE